MSYNGMPDNCHDDIFPWEEDKYEYVCHAELNAIMNKNSADIRGCTIYVTRFPCSGCTKLIIQSGIADVVYVYAKHIGRLEYIASRRMLEAVGVRHRKYTPDSPEIKMNYAELDDDYEQWRDVDFYNPAPTSGSPN